MRSAASAVLLLAVMAGVGARAPERPRPPAGQLVGRTLALVDGEPVSHGNVVLLPLPRPRGGGSLTATADSIGNFHFDSLPAGAYRVRVHRVGFSDAAATVHVLAGERRVLDLFLPPHGYDPAVQAARLAAMERERTRWQHARPNRYEFSFDLSCFCLGRMGGWTMEVGPDSSVVARRPRHASPGTPITNVDSLFLWLEEEIGNPGMDVRVRYHPRLGYPVEIHSSPHVPIHDADTHVRVSRLVPLPDRD